MRAQALVSSVAARHPYLASVAMIAVVTALGLTTASVLHPANVNVLYLLAVLVSALNWGRRPGLFTAITSAVVFDFAFIPPYFSFAITDLAYIVTLVGFVALAVITSELAGRARDAMAAEAARQQAEAVAAAKDALLDRIAHELRTPLTTVQGSLHLLAATIGDPAQGEKHLHRSQRGARLLARLIGDLVDASRISSGKLHVRLEPAAIHGVIARGVDDVLPAADEKGVEIRTAIDIVPIVLADTDRVEQIVVNLVSNAIKFTPAGATIQVRLHTDGDGVALVVADTGDGIDPEFLPHVFEPFAQGADAHQGLGLGLTIVKNLVAAHSGTIAVRSDGRGRGTTFTIRLPLAPVDAQVEKTTSPPPASSNHTRSPRSTYSH